MRTFAKLYRPIAATLAVGLLTGTALAFAAPAQAADGTALVNESFESSTSLPAGWTFQQYEPNVSTATIATGTGVDGTHFLQISSPKPNHAHVQIPLSVTQNATYHFHAMAKGAGGTGKLVAVLGTSDQTDTSASVSTDTTWQPLDVYVKVGENTTATFMLSLGGFGSVTAGTADFDSVQISPADSVPSGAKVIVMAAPAGAQAAANTQSNSADSANASGASPKTLVYAIIVVGLLAAVAYGIYFMRRRDAATAEPDEDEEEPDSSEPDSADSEGSNPATSGTGSDGAS